MMSTSYIRAIVALIIALIFVVGCGPGSKQRAIRATFASVDASAAAFVVWDGNEQKRIVDDAESHEEGQTNLTLHRLRRAAIVHAFELAYRAIAIAAMDPTDAHLAEATLAAKNVYHALDDAVGEGTTP